MIFAKIRTLSHFCRSSRGSTVIALEVLVGMSLCLFLMVICIFLTREMLEQDFTQFDIQFAKYVYTLRTPLVTTMMMGASALGSSLLLLIASVFTILLLLKKHQKEAMLFCVALLIGLFLDTSFKLMIQRPRPQISPLVIENSYSFPSGHAMNALIFYGLISYFSYHFFRNRKLSLVITLVSGVLVLLIGFSRIYLGVHYFTDVIAGYITGFWWFVTVLLLERIFMFYRLFKETK